MVFGMFVVEMYFTRKGEGRDFDELIDDFLIIVSYSLQLSEK